MLIHLYRVIHLGISKNIKTEEMISYHNWIFNENYILKIWNFFLFPKSLLFDLFPSAGSGQLWVFTFSFFFVDYVPDDNSFYIYIGKSCIKYYSALFRFELNGSL